uniref:Protein TIC 214 n=1 Tax=Cryptomeria japonica var. sinensis TaxID=99810 RepID=A0A7D5FXH5_CRYJA|nr:hypothetical protein RF1 [Cryptomeria japonica var. sinensis]UFA48283.1 RNA polymerase beta' subunit [Cryptomeria japonica var. sinensis]UFA48365.1 RNA polymerase beta' subunit [Cryptomeria japonica var. sinensis]UFA48447.1 RNA polymerase beta' subunit [Cryptomeria japonica var. sinensis]UFA48531.1 RNA polymerase beta' subunit [Cryptomeria japonica var. sinensis]
MIAFLLPWIQRSIPIVLFGVYYGFLSTLPIGPAQMYYLRSLLIKDKILDTNGDKSIPTGKLILSGSFLGQVIIFSSIYLCPIYSFVLKPHAMTLMFVPVFLFLFIRILFSNVLFPWMNNPVIEFFLGIALQLLNPALFGKSVYPRLINIMLFRYSGSLLFLMSTAAGWLTGQILFVKITNLFCLRVEGDSPLKLGKRRQLFAFTFQVIFFGYFMLACYGKNPSLFVTKYVDNRAFLQGPLEEFEESSQELDQKKKAYKDDYKQKTSKKKKKIKATVSLSSISRKMVRVLSLKELSKETDADLALSNILIKTWPLLFFDYNRFNVPTRYVGVGNFILRGPVKSQVAEYFFDACLSDGHQRLSFTAPPSISFFAKMVNLGDQSLDRNQDHLFEWVSKKGEKKSFLALELEDRVRALSNGSPLVDVIEKKIRFSRTKDGNYLPEIHDPLLSGPFRGSVNQFKSPWMLPPDDSTEQLQKNAHDSTNQLDRISLIRPENKEKIVQLRNEKIKIISKWWLDKIRIFLLEEQEKRKFLDDASLANLLSRFEAVYPKDSVEYVLKTLAPAPLTRRIEKEIASCNKKIFIQYLLQIFLETTGTKSELLVSVLPTEQALLYERFFLMSSDELPNSEVSIDTKKIPQEISDKDLPSKKSNAKKKNKKKLDQDFQDFFDFYALYLKFMELKKKAIVNDYEPRIRDFNRCIVPKWPSTIISGIYDTMCVKDCLETRPKKARHLIVIKPFEKIKELELEDEQKKSEQGILKGFSQWFKDENQQSEEQEQIPEQEIANEAEDEAEEDLVTKDIHVFSYPYEGDFRRFLVKGAVRSQRRKVSVVNNWIPRPQSSLFERLKEMMQKPRRKPNPKREIKKDITISRLVRYFDKYLDRKQKREENRRRQIQQGFDWELLHYLRAGVLFTHTYLRKRLYFPSLIIAKNFARVLLFQAPEWERDWSNLNREFYIKCNYDGYELTDIDVPKDWMKDYLKEGIQIKIVYPFRLRPWYESTPQSTDADNRTTSFLSMYGTENELPFGNPTKVPSFWRPIGECILNSTSHRTKAIIERIHPIIERIKPILQWIELLYSERVKIKINIRPDTGTENIQTNDEPPVMIRTTPTSNIKFSLEIMEDPLEPFSMQIQDLDLADPDNWTITIHERIKQMNEEYLLNRDIHNKLRADFENRMNQPSPDIKSRLKKGLIRIKIFGSIFQNKSVRFIRKKMPYFMKVFHLRAKLTLIDLKISILTLIESNLEFYVQLSRNIEAIQKRFTPNRNINPSIKKKETPKISQAYIFHKIWQQVISMKGSYAKDLLKSRASSPFIKQNVKDFLDSQGLLNCNDPRELTAKDWKQWLKWCAGYRIMPQKNKKIISSRFGWNDFASFLGEKQFACFLRRLKNRIKLHRYHLFAYSYLDHSKEDNHGPAIQYIPEPDYQAITNFQQRKNPGYSKKKRKKNFDSSKKNNSDSSTTRKNSYYKFHFWLFPDIRKKAKNASNLDDLFPPDIIRKHIKHMWEFREIQIAQDFDVDAYVMESLRKREDEKRNKLAELQKIKEERRQRKQERQKTKEQRLQKLELATTPEEVKNLKRAFKLEDEQKRLERMQELKKRFQEHKKAIKARQLERQAEKRRQEKEKKEKKELRKKLRQDSKLAKKINEFIVRDFRNIYHRKRNYEKINTEKEKLRIAIKKIILKRDAKKNSQGDKKGWDELKLKLDSGFDNKNKKVGVTSETKNGPKGANKQEIKHPRGRKRFEKEEGKEENPQRLKKKTDKLPYREMAKNIRVWKTKYKLEKLPLAPWLSKGRNASRFLDKKKLGNEAAVAQLTTPYLENGELDLDLLETILYLKSCFQDNKNDFLRIFADERRRSIPLVPGYFNDRFLIYKIASLFLKLKKKRINVNLFDRSQRRRKTIEDVNEKISSSFIFEDILLPKRRREFRILNLLNLETPIDQSIGLNSKAILNDEGLIEKDEPLCIDTRAKIRRFLWPRYRVEDLICMNRFWWNTSNGSRSVMLRVRMYPKIDHWEHMQNSFYFIKQSFVSIREILQDLANRTKSLLGTKRSPVFGQNEPLNQAEMQKKNNFCSISASFPSGRSPRNELLTKMIKLISSFREKLRKFLTESRDSLPKLISSFREKLRKFLTESRDSLPKLISSFREKLRKFLTESRDSLLKNGIIRKNLRKFLTKLKNYLSKKKWVRTVCSKITTELEETIRYLDKYEPTRWQKIKNFVKSWWMAYSIGGVLVPLGKDYGLYFGIPDWLKFKLYHLASKIAFIAKDCFKLAFYSIFYYFFRR